MESVNYYRYNENESAEERKNKVTKIMDMYHSGDEEMQKHAMMCMLTYLEGYKITLVMRTYGTYVMNYRDDLMQCADMGIIKGMALFDPEKGEPTTFFKNHMRDEIQNFINKDVTDLTVYYSGVVRDIRHLQGDRLKRGLETTVDDAVVILKGKHSASTIRAAYDMMQMQDAKEVLRDDGDIIDDSDESYVVQPEQLFLKKEESNELYKAINMLDPDERYVTILGNGLYKSDMRILENILKTVTQYTAFEKLIANGFEPEKALQIMGFSSEAILIIKGLNKTDASRFCRIITTGLNEENEDDYSRIMNFLVSEESQRAFRENLNNKTFEKVLKNLGCSNYKQIIAGQCIPNDILIKDISELSVRNLMLGKGFLDKDVDFILATGKEMSGAKISALVPLVEKKDVRSIDAAAKKKLKRYLMNNQSFMERHKKRDTSINDTTIPCMEENNRYINTYFNDLESVSDEMMDDDVEFEIIC